MTNDTINDAVTMQGSAQGALLANRYRVVRQLGQGGMGSVWLAEDTQLDGKLFAIKMLPSILVSNKRAYRQLKDEALVAMQLVHPNIVQIRAFEENNGNPFLVMDYIDGQTLDDYLAEYDSRVEHVERVEGDVGRDARPARPSGGLPEDEVVRILKPIAAALDYAHSKGVVHRDVKPGNVMIAKDGTPYILDFGIAREIQETMTRVTGKLSSGTLLYMSPEQLNGDAPKPAQDVYSFAAMAYECLKGELPFSRGNIEFQIMNKAPEPLGPHFAKSGSVMRGLAKKLEDRPKTCVAVLERHVPDVLQANGARHVVSVEGNPAKGWSKEPFKRANKSRVGVVGSCIVFFAAVLVVITTCVLYFKSPRIYEAKSEFTLDVRRPSGGSRGQGAVAEAPLGYGVTYAEIFNTRISDWRSKKVIMKVVQQYRASNPSSTVSDEEIIGTLAGSKLDLIRDSRIVTIALRSKTPELAASLANAYAEAIESFTDEENKIRCDKAVSQLHGNVEKKRREVDKIAKQLLDFRTANKVDSLRSSRDTISQSLSKTTGEILSLETEEAQLIEWEKMLTAVQKDPASYGNLSTRVPRAQEIATEFRAYQDAEGQHQKLLVAFTDSHPDVVAAKKELEQAKRQFLDAAERALLTGRSTLRVTRNKLANIRTKQEDLRNELAAVEQRVVLAESALGQLEAEFGVANRVLEGLILKENDARIQAEANNEIVRVGRLAVVPSKPVLPNMFLMFGTCGGILVVLGILFAVFRFCIRTQVESE